MSSSAQGGVPFQAYFNQMVEWMLFSPMHSLLSEHLMLLTYSGKKSGLKRRVPLTYLQEGSIVSAFCSRDVVWWKNLQGGAAVLLRLRGHNYTAIATPITDDAAHMIPTFTAFLRQNRQAGGFQDIPFNADGSPDMATIERVIHSKVMVRIALD
jgi:hypothetical protein